MYTGCLTKTLVKSISRNINCKLLEVGTIINSNSVIRTKILSDRYNVWLYRK